MHQRTFAHGARAGLTATLFAVAMIAPSSSFAETANARPAAGRAQTAQAVPVDELRARFGGFYRYAGDARERDARQEAIERSAATFFFAVRGVAKSKLDDRTRIMPTCKFEFAGGKISSTVPGLPTATSPESGAPAPYRVEDDAILLSQYFEGAHLVQVFRADEGGTRRNEFSLSADGSVLTMRATLSSPKLSVPVTYTLTYRRA